jgi:hypothetical protein
LTTGGPDGRPGRAVVHLDENRGAKRERPRDEGEGRIERLVHVLEAREELRDRVEVREAPVQAVGHDASHDHARLWTLEPRPVRASSFAGIR